MTPFGIYIRHLRAQKKISLRSLADGVHVTPSYLSAIEHGKKGAPNQRLIKRISDFLELSENEAEALTRACAYSQNKFVIPANCNASVYYIAHLLEQKAEKLSNLELRMLQAILGKNDTSQMEEIMFGAKY